MEAKSPHTPVPTSWVALALIPAQASWHLLSPVGSIVSSQEAQQTGHLQTKSHRPF